MGQIVIPGLPNGGAITVTRNADGSVANVNIAAGTNAAANNAVNLTGNAISIQSSGVDNVVESILIKANSANGGIQMASPVFIGIDSGNALSLNGTGTLEFTGGQVAMSADTTIDLIAGGDISLTAGGADGDVNLNIAGTGTVTLGTQLQNFANDAAAQAGGIPLRGLYRNGSVVQVRVV